MGDITREILSYKGLKKTLKLQSKTELINKVADLGIRTFKAEKALYNVTADKLAAEDRVAALEDALETTRNALAIESRISLRMEIRNLSLLEQLSKNEESQKTWQAKA